MNQNYFPKLKTKRLSLRVLKKTDWKIISYLRSDNKINEYIKIPSAETKEKALKYILKINHGIKNKEYYYWAITEINNNQMIGNICLWNFSKDKKMAEVGYALNFKFQKKGIMTESLISVLEFGFKTLKLDFIEAYTHRENEPSKKMLTSNGFTLAKNKIDENNQNNIVYQIKNSYF